MRRMRRKNSNQYTIFDRPVKELKVQMAVMPIKPEEPPVPAVASLFAGVFIKNVNQPVKRQFLIRKPRRSACKVAIMLAWLKILKPRGLHVACALIYQTWWQKRPVSTDGSNESNPRPITCLQRPLDFSLLQHLDRDYVLRLVDVALKEALLVGVVAIFRLDVVFLHFSTNLTRFQQQYQTELDTYELKILLILQPIVCFLPS